MSGRQRCEGKEEEIQALPHLSLLAILHQCYLHILDHQYSQHVLLVDISGQSHFYISHQHCSQTAMPLHRKCVHRAAPGVHCSCSLCAHNHHHCCCCSLRYWLCAHLRYTGGNAFSPHKAAGHILHCLLCTHTAFLHCTFSAYAASLHCTFSGHTAFLHGAFFHCTFSAQMTGWYYSVQGRWRWILLVPHKLNFH